MTIAGTAVKLEAAIATQYARTFAGAKLRLRFDRVALRFVADLRSALQEIVPDGATVIFNIAAPIRLAAKTAGELEKQIHRRLTRPPADAGLTCVINANPVRVRVVHHGLAHTAKVIGLVYTPGPNPKSILDAAEALLR